MDYRDCLLEMIEDGRIEESHLLLCCLKAMSQEQLAIMCHREEIEVDGWFA